jgi:hypothetical protein
MGMTCDMEVWTPPVRRQRDRIDTSTPGLKTPALQPSVHLHGHSGSWQPQHPEVFLQQLYSGDCIAAHDSRSCTCMMLPRPTVYVKATDGAQTVKRHVNNAGMPYTAPDGNDSLHLSGNNSLHNPASWIARCTLLWRHLGEHPCLAQQQGPPLLGPSQIDQRAADLSGSTSTCRYYSARSFLSVQARWPALSTERVSTSIRCKANGSLACAIPACRPYPCAVVIASVQEYANPSSGLICQIHSALGCRRTSI